MGGGPRAKQYAVSRLMFENLAGPTIIFDPMTRRPENTSIGCYSTVHTPICWIPTGLFLIGHTCHRIENGGGPRNISNPESGNSILLGTGASPPVSGNSILDTNTIKEISKEKNVGPPAILYPMTRMPDEK